MLKHILSRMDNVESEYELEKSVSILDAILWISSTLKQVTSTTISNCFKKVGFVFNDHASVIDDGVEENNLKEHNFRI